MNDTDISQSRSYFATAKNALSSLFERDETPGLEPSLDEVISHPAPFPNEVLKTPQTENRARPPLEEMHPSKVQQSTAKQLDSGLSLGFSDINAQHPATPSKSTVKATEATEPTSTKVRGDQVASPKMNFNWDRPESLLSPEGRKIMESVREDAAHIKLKMQQERDEQVRRDGEAKQLFGVGGRQIAQPKGKSGRYSDIHRQEFKKMDSITGHASTWKNKVPTKASASLERTQSKAGYDEAESSFDEASSEPPMKLFETDRLENTAPGKRAKQNYSDDTSTMRPASRDSQRETKVSAPGIPRAIPSLPSVMTTPTKASLARSASVRNLQPSKIPSLSHSKSSKELTSPATTKVGGNKYLSTLPRMGSMKSILHKPPPKFSDDPAKVAAGTHFQIPRGKASLDNDSTGLPSTLTQDSPVKHVNFTPTTQAKIDLAATSPSPTKIPLPHFQRPMLQPSKGSEEITYPSIAKLGPLNSNPSQPGDFTFRSNKQINLGPATSGLKSPTKTIRQVRPSGITTPLAPFDNLPAIPHGMANKKRRREEHDEEEVENKELGTEEVDDAEGPRVKKQKSARKNVVVTSGVDRKKSTQSKVANPATTKEKAKGKGLSMSRLNTLARPKGRR